MPPRRAGGQHRSWSSRHRLAPVLIGALLATVLTGCSTTLGRTSGGVEGPEPAPVDRYPRNASRFDLRPASDTTVRFAPAESRWVRVGLEGIAVDPAQGDALVARFRVLAVDADSATALVTGQTTRLASGHVALLLPPAKRPWRDRAFWWGVASATGTMALVALAVLAL
jgi:hypothetical protein